MKTTFREFLSDAPQGVPRPYGVAFPDYKNDTTPILSRAARAASCPVQQTTGPPCKSGCLVQRPHRFLPALHCNANPETGYGGHRARRRANAMPDDAPETTECCGWSMNDQCNPCGR